MPGFAPTLTQAARLFHLPVADCERAMGTLVRDGFLTRQPDGTYRIASE
jgi:DNA-binding IclR family transcriptional regulator